MKKAGIDRTLGVLSKFVLALAMLSVAGTLQAEDYQFVVVSKAYDPEEQTCSFWWSNSEATGWYSWTGEDVTIKVGEEISRQLNGGLELVMRCERGHTTAFIRALSTSGRMYNRLYILRRAYGGVRDPARRLFLQGSQSDWRSTFL